MSEVGQLKFDPHDASGGQHWRHQVTTRHHGCSVLRDVGFYLQSVNNIQFVLSGLLSRRLYWMPRLLDIARSKKVRKKDRRPLERNSTDWKRNLLPQGPLFHCKFASHSTLHIVTSFWFVSSILYVQLKRARVVWENWFWGRDCRGYQTAASGFLCDGEATGSVSRAFPVEVFDIAKSCNITAYRSMSESVTEHRQWLWIFVSEANWPSSWGQPCRTRLLPVKFCQALKRQWRQKRCSSVNVL